MKHLNVTVSLVVDTNPAFGRGHISRSLLLAQEISAQGASCRFFLTNQIDMAGLRSFPVSLLANSLPSTGDIVVVDGYRFDGAFLQHLKGRASRLVVIDDLADKIFPADVILNHNIYASRLEYPQQDGTNLLLGPHYGLVRQDFFALRQRNGDHANSILVTFGSGPVAQRGVDLAHELHRRLRIPVDVTVGADANLPDDGTEVIRFHRWVDLAQLAETASLVICGLGVTFLEILATGRQLIAIQVADNQRLAYLAAKEAGYCVFDEIDLDRIIEAAGRLRNCAAAPHHPFHLDSQGPARAAAAILENMN